MSDKIRQLIKKSDFLCQGLHGTMVLTQDELQKFAELIVRECAENFTKVWYEQGLDIRGAEIDKFMNRFNEHLGVK